MTVTLGECRLALRDSLNEQHARAWTDNYLDRLIYEGCKDLARATEYLETTVDLDVTVAEQQPLLPSDIIRVYMIQWQDDGSDFWATLEYRDFNNSEAVSWLNTSATGFPYMMTMWGAVPNLKALLYPAPASAGTLRVHYYRLPIDPRTQTTDDDDDPVPILPDTVTLELPEGWDDTVRLYAEYQALRRDRDPRWQEAKALYDEELGKLYDLTRRHTDQSGQFIGRGFPSANAWLYQFDDAWGG